MEMFRLSLRALCSITTVEDSDPTHEAHLQSIPQPHSLQNLTFQQAALEAEPFPPETAQVSALITFNHQVTHYPFKAILF